MSEQEQEQRIGRTVKQRAEAVRELAALKAKASDYADAMRKVLAELPEAKTTPTEAIERCPDRMELLALFGEMRDLKARIDQLSQLLREMGIAD